MVLLAFWMISTKNVVTKVDANLSFYLFMKIFWSLEILSFDLVELQNLVAPNGVQMNKGDL
jgi:hypothetical protein